VTYNENNQLAKLARTSSASSGFGLLAVCMNHLPALEFASPTDTGWVIILCQESCCLSVGFEGFTAVTMKNAVFCVIKTQFVLHRRHITSPLQRPAS
jgi:hypothetical protein